MARKVITLCHWRGMNSYTTPAFSTGCMHCMLWPCRDCLRDTVTHKVLQAEEEYNKNTGHGRLKLWYAISIMKMNSTYCFLSQTEKLYTNLRTNDVCVSDRSCSPPTFELLPFGPEPSGIECSWSSQFVGFGGCFWELAFQIEQATFSFAGKRSQEWNSSGCVGR